MIADISTLTKFQLITRMRHWIVTLTERLGEDAHDIDLSGADLNEILSIASHIRHRIEARGMFVDWDIHDRLVDRFGAAETDRASTQLDPVTASDIVALFRKLIGVLAFMLLKFGEVGRDGESVFEPAPESLWDVS